MKYKKQLLKVEGIFGGNFVEVNELYCYDEVVGYESTFSFNDTIDKTVFLTSRKDIVEKALELNVDAKKVARSWALEESHCDIEILEKREKKMVNEIKKYRAIEEKYHARVNQIIEMIDKEGYEHTGFSIQKDGKNKITTIDYVNSKNVVISISVKYHYVEKVTQEMTVDGLKVISDMTI